MIPLVHNVPYTSYALKMLIKILTYIPQRFLVIVDLNPSQPYFTLSENSFCILW